MPVTTGWLRLPLSVVAAIAILMPSAQATCSMFRSSLSPSLPARLLDGCGCEQPATYTYVMQCSSSGMRSMPCPAGAGGELATADAWISSGDPSQRGTVVLNFSGNAVADLQRGCLAAYVRHVNGANEELILDLTGNSLEMLTSAAFSGVEAHLRVLNVSRNRLRQLIGGSGWGPFVALELQVLDLSANHIVHPCGLYFRQATSLRLDGNEIVSLARDCFNSRQGGIASLNLSNNAIRSIDEDAFKSVGGLVELLLAGNRLTATDSDSSIGLGSGSGPVAWMQHLGGLRRLDLSGNRVSAMGQLCRSPALRTLDYLDLSRNGIRSVEPYCFKSQESDGRGKEGIGTGGSGIPSASPLSALPLLELRLDENELETIMEHAFEGLKQRLASLGLASNRLTSITAMALHGMTQLRSLNLSNNALADLSCLCGLEAPQLSELVVRHNALQALLPDLLRRPLCRVGLNLNRLRSLDVSGNRLRELAAGDLATLAPGIETLDLSNNELVTLRTGAFAGLASLRRLRLSGNSLAHLGACAFVGPWPRPPLPSATDSARRLVELHYNGNPLHCDGYADDGGGCSDGRGASTSRWLLQFGTAISRQGARDPSVAVPVQHAICSMPEAARGLSIDRLPSSSRAGGSSCSTNITVRLLPEKQICGELRVAPSIVNGTLRLSWIGDGVTRANHRIFLDVMRVGTGEMLVRSEPIGGSNSEVNGTVLAVMQLPGDDGGSTYELCMTVVRSDDGVWQLDCTTVYPYQVGSGAGVGMTAVLATDRWRGSGTGQQQQQIRVEAGHEENIGAVAAAAVLAVLIVFVVSGSVLMIWLLHRKYRRALENCKPLSEVRNRRESRTGPSLSFSSVTASSTKPCAADAMDGTTDSLLQDSSSSSNAQSSSLGGLSIECGYIKEWTPMRRVVMEDYL